MGHGPKPCRNGQRIDPVDLPPRAFVATAMELTMVQPAKRDGEAVADLAPHRPLLGKLDVVGIGRGAAADEAGLSGHEAQMVAVALAHRLANDGDFRGGWFGALSPGSCAFASWVLLPFAAASSPSSRSLATKPASTAWQSGVESWFFSGSTRCAHAARASGSPSCSSSEISCCRSFSEASGGN